MHRRALGLLATGHLSVDACQGVVPALLPFLIARRGLSYGEASALVLASTVAGSVLQPLFGILSDRRSMAWIMPAGVIVGGAGIAVCGVFTSYAAMFVAITISGIGVAAYHPESARYAQYASGDRASTGMSLYSVGGNAGLALGPVMVTPLVLLFGLPGTLGLIVMPLLVGGVLTVALPRLQRLRHAVTSARTAAPGRNHWGAFGRLTTAIVLRSWIYFGMLTFVPLYFVEELGTSNTNANVALTVMLAAGAVGTLIGGPLADRVGPRTVFAGSMVALPPLIGLFLLASPGIAIGLLALIGATTIATFSLGVVLSQALLPGHLGVASGVSLGAGIGMGGVGASLLGFVADAIGLRGTIEVIAVLPLLALALTLTLPRRTTGAAAAEPARAPA